MYNKERTAIILCGGRGTRLGSLGKKVPKTLVKIIKYPILWYILKALKKNNFNHFILPIGYKGRLIKKFINNNIYFRKMNIDIVDTGQNSNIAYRIYKIQNFIKSQKFLLLNGDAIFDFDINKIYENNLKKDMTFITCETESNFGTVGIKNGKVIDFIRNIKYDSVTVRGKPNYIGKIYSGMSIMNKKVLKYNFKNIFHFEKHLYPKIIKNHLCNIENINGFWHAIDNTKDINELVSAKNKNYKFKKINMIINKLEKIK
jgi:glucose-1-phosphate cytidylyltransferase